MRWHQCVDPCKVMAQEMGRYSLCEHLSNQLLGQLQKNWTCFPFFAEILGWKLLDISFFIIIKHYHESNVYCDNVVNGGYSMYETTFFGSRGQ